VAQLAEQLICNQQVIGSSPIIGSDGVPSIDNFLFILLLLYGRFLSGNNDRNLIISRGGAVGSSSGS
jgi:hypothetical protein